VIRAAIIAICCVACTPSAPTCTLPPRPAQTPPFLWKVSKAGGPVVWLYGTLHDLGRDEVPAAAWTALEASRQFASELGEVEPDRDKLHDLARLPPGKGLDQLLPADTWYDLRDILRGTIKEDDLKRARPWYAITLLTKKAAPPPSPGMDVALAERAHDRHIPVDPLESWDDQLASLGDAVTVNDLAQAIDGYKQMSCQISRIKAAYGAGDLAVMGQLLGAEQSATLLDARNQRWLPKLVHYLDTTGAFVAVGVSHLAGDRGIPAVLEKAGYTVERLR
jgi:uncharacterized protein YbaP (TraB family)